MEDCKEATTLIATNCLMDANEAGYQVDSIEMRSQGGMLLEDMIKI